MYKPAITVLCLATILVSGGVAPAAADIDLSLLLDGNGPGYLFSYNSLVQDPGGGYDTYYYYYYLQNNSTDHQIVSWTWSGGNVQPSTHPAAFVYDGCSDFPMPSAESEGLDDAYYRAEDFEDMTGPVVVQSTITWEDNHQSFCQIAVPGTLVPEPGSLLSLACGVIGLTGSWTRRRK